MDMFNIKITPIHEIGTVVYLANEKSELGSVSYTHLDVYKRQHLKGTLWV